MTFAEDASAEAVFAAGSMHDLNGKRVEVKPATPKGSGSRPGGSSGGPGRPSGGGGARGGGMGLPPFGGAPGGAAGSPAALFGSPPSPYAAAGFGMFGYPAAGAWEIRGWGNPVQREAMRPACGGLAAALALCHR